MDEPRDKFAAFAQEWTRAQPVIAAYISSVVPNFHESEDLLQSVAAALIKSIENYDPTRPFVAWAIGVAKNHVLMHRRRSTRDRHVFDSQAMAQLEAAYADLEHELESRKEALAHCLGRLDAWSRSLLEMRYARALSPATIAQTINAQPNAVRVMLFRVRGQLRGCIERRIAGRVAR